MIFVLFSEKVQRSEASREKEGKKIPRNWVISGKGSSCAFPHHSSMDKNIYCWAGHEIHASYTTWRTSTNLEARSWLRFGNGSIFTRLQLYHPITDEHIISRCEISYAHPNKWYQKMIYEIEEASLLRIFVSLFEMRWEPVKLTPSRSQCYKNHKNNL